jgi:hypothetical protein
VSSVYCILYVLIQPAVSFNHLSDIGGSSEMNAFILSYHIYSPTICKFSVNLFLPETILETETSCIILLESYCIVATSAFVTGTGIAFRVNLFGFSVLST